jgi:hypothetical protein
MRTLHLHFDEMDGWRIPGSMTWNTLGLPNISVHGAERTTLLAFLLAL